MRAALSALLFAAFLAFVAAHLALVVTLAKKRTPMRAALALVIPPLAPFWGYELGAERLASAWLAALITYVAVLVTLSA